MERHTHTRTRLIKANRCPNRPSDGGPRPRGRKVSGTKDKYRVQKTAAWVEPASYVKRLQLTEGDLWGHNSARITDRAPDDESP